jgi:hypothetical protein
MDGAGVCRRSGKALQLLESRLRIEIRTRYELDCGVGTFQAIILTKSFTFQRSRKNIFPFTRHFQTRHVQESFEKALHFQKSLVISLQI